MSLNVFHSGTCPTCGSTDEDRELQSCSTCPGLRGRAEKAESKLEELQEKLDKLELIVQHLEGIPEINAWTDHMRSILNESNEIAEDHNPTICLPLDVVNAVANVLSLFRLAAKNDMPISMTLACGCQGPVGNCPCVKRWKLIENFYARIGRPINGQKSYV